MTSLNKLGLTVVLITALVLAVLFGAWWGVKKYWLAPAAAPAPASESAVDTPSQPAFPSQILTLPLGNQVAEANTWTQKYLASLPEDTPPDQILDETRLEAFVNVNKGQLLPTLPEGLIKTTPASGKEAIKMYLDAISPVQNKNLSTVSNQDIETAWRLAYQNNQPETINSLIQKLHNNVDVLQAVAAPEELEALHTKITAAAHALTNNTELLRDMNKDFVGGLIGAKNIEELGAVFGEIQEEIKALDEKYDL